MAFRVVMLESEASIHLKLNNLIINKGEGDIWIPISDISMIVVDNLKITITARLLSQLAEYNIGVIICNLEHLPIGFYCAYDNHSRISKNISFQIDKEKSFYDEIWQLIVKTKIINQKQVLELLKKDNESQNKLDEYIKDVPVGDITNREAVAAKVYFNALMGTSFSRGNADILLNSGLDYGYSIIRSYIARLCVGYGLNTQIGIHHKNEFNRFNLVDDLMEPFRPFVDFVAYHILDNEEYFKIEHRRKLTNILNHKIIYKGKTMFLASMMEDYVSQYSSLLMNKNETIVFPEILNYLEEKDDK